MEVNFFGVVAVTEAAMPHLRASGGRVFTVSSVRGAVGQPFNEASCAAKFAVEGFLESLAPVAATVGVGVAIVEPGAVTTEFVNNVSPASERGLPEAGRDRRPPTGAGLPSNRDVRPYQERSDGSTMGARRDQAIPSSNRGAGHDGPTGDQRLRADGAIVPASGADLLPRVRDRGRQRPRRPRGAGPAARPGLRARPLSRTGPRRRPW